MTYEFGPFRYDAGQRLLFRGGERVPLLPKVADTLHVLIERHGQVIDKPELMRLVWPDTTVEDVGLARNISLLRKALDDDDDANPYIETIPRRGYRFAAAITEPPAPAAQPEPPAAPPVRRPRPWWIAIAAAVVAAAAAFGYYQFFVPSKHLTAQAGGVKGASLAVVPFTCHCPNLDGEQFSQGFTDVLVADLARKTSAQIVAPSTVRRHQRAGVSMGLMGRLLGLDGLVEGSIQQLDGQLRITARLVDVHTGKVIWSETYDKPATELSSAQSTAAAAISDAVRRVASSP